MINRRFKANRPKIIGSTDINPYWKVIEEIIQESDIIFEILDARLPELSRNEEIERLAEQNNKTIVLILNKADLVSEKQLQITYDKLKKQKPCFIFSSKEKIGTKRLREWLLSKTKGVEKLKVGILGYPNTGKSSIINSLAKKKKAKVSAKAGTTHGPQWVNATDKLRIIDSPGVIPLKQEDEVRYAIIASKNVERIKNLDLVAHAIIKLFDDKTQLEKFYNIKINPDIKNPDEIIEMIAVKKGFIKKGGTPDENRTAIQIIRDWQTGRLKLA